MRLWTAACVSCVLGQAFTASLPASLKLDPRLQYESFIGEPLKSSVEHFTPECDDGALFVTPSLGMMRKDQNAQGPRILDKDANLIWMEPKWGTTADLKVQQFEGRNVMTFWHGTIQDGIGNGSYAMLDTSYRLAKKIRAAEGHVGDFHEFQLTERGTALMTVYAKMCVDLSDMGMAQDGWIYDSMIQEVDVISGELLFEWKASEHVPLEESIAPTDFRGHSAERPFDFFHITSIDVDLHGNYVVAARNLGAVLGIKASTGQVLWQLGGKSNQFTAYMDQDLATNIQEPYHARMYGANHLTVYDAATRSGRLIELDFQAKTARLAREYKAPRVREEYGVTLKGRLHGVFGRRNLHYESSDGFSSGDYGSIDKSKGAGSMQILPSGNVVLGSGSVVTEFSATGEALCQTQLGPKRIRSTKTKLKGTDTKQSDSDLNADADTYDSEETSTGYDNVGSTYRAFKATQWIAYPQALPDVAVRPKSLSKSGREMDVLHVSWNGATQVDGWLLESSYWGYRGQFTAILMVKKRGFETKIVVPPDSGDMVRVVAMNGDDRILGWSWPMWKGIRSKPLREGPRIPPKANLMPVAIAVAVLGLLFILRRRIVSSLTLVLILIKGRMKGYKIARA